MGHSLSLPSPVRQFNRNLVIGGSVVLFHIVALWALQSGLLRRAVEIIVPIAVLSEIVTPPAPKVEQPPEVVPPKPIPAPKQPVPRKVETKPVVPQPLAVPYPEPSPQAPVVDARFQFCDAGLQEFAMQRARLRLPHRSRIGRIKAHGGLQRSRAIDRQEHFLAQ